MAADPAGFCKVKFVYTDGEGSVYPGMEGKLVGAPTDAQLSTFAALIGARWQTRLAALTNPIWTLDHVKLIYSDGTLEHVGIGPTAVVGTLGATTSSPRSACVVSGFQIASYYRGGKPRTYWPNLGRYQAGSSTHWQVALISDYDTAVGLLISDVNGLTTTGVTSFTLGCIRRRRLGSAIVPPEFYPYLSHHTDSRICSQRDRLGPL